MPVERIQSPSGGMNTDASPDYLANNEAVLLENLLPDRRGKVVMRGGLEVGVDVTASTTYRSLDAFWAFDDTPLIKLNTSGTTYRITSAITVKTDVTATLVESPANSVHARYGAYVYGAIVDAANPQLGRWDGLASAIVPQANAPFQFTDLQVFAQRLFVLGGSTPGTTTPVINSSRVLFYSDPNPAADLSLLASWQDDVSAVTNQIQYDGDDTPVGLAGCGRYMAIVGTRSINILTGSGSSSFAVRNLTRNWGCTSRESIVEVDDGFYFLSDRGLAFCDGASVSLVSDNVRDDVLYGTDPTAAQFDRGYFALCFRTLEQACWLYHASSKTWVQIVSGRFPAQGTLKPYSVHRCLTYGLIWDGRNLWSANEIFDRTDGTDSGAGGATLAVQARWSSRIARLAAPGQKATITRVMLDYALRTLDTADWTVTVRNEQGLPLASGTGASYPSSGSRRHMEFEVYAEATTAYLDITFNPTGTPAVSSVELYDAWIEFTPAQNRGSVS